jgi:hypothetical protein
LCRIVTTPVLSSGSATSARLAGGEQSLVRRSLEVRGLARWVAARPGGWTVAGERLLVVLVDEVVRRNRLHIVVVVTVAVLNYWAAVSVILIGFGWVFASDLVRRRFDSSSSLLLIVACSLALGAVVSVSWVTLQMRYVRRWTLRRIGAVDLHPGELPRVENLLAELAIAAGAPPVRAALCSPIWWVCSRSGSGGRWPARCHGAWPAPGRPCDHDHGRRRLGRPAIRAGAGAAY